MAVSSSHPVGARRLISVVFADLVGFTTLSEVLDAEDVATIQQAYFGRARAAIEERGGAVEKFIGDAVVGTFGLPHGHGDDPRHAVAAGLAIVEAVAQVGSSLGLDDAALRVRVGIDTGEVHVTFAPDGSWQLTGNVMNVAARLQAAAEPGTVLLGAATALAAEPAFHLRSRGEKALKGKSERVATWEAEAPRDRPSRAWALSGLRTPTLGRDDLLAELAAPFAANAAVGTGNDAAPEVAWLINAPPGAGKTRVVDELEARVLASGHPVWRATVAEGITRAYASVAGLLDDALGDVERDPAAIRAELIRRLEAGGGDGRRVAVAADHATALLVGTGLTGTLLEGAVEDLYASWTAALDALAGGRRVLWVIEDVHHAPADLLSFLRHALAVPTATQRSVVLTCRPRLLTDAGPDPLPGTRVIHLPPLEPSLVRALIEALVGEHVVPPALAEGIAAVAGGNPLFVEELLRTWVQADVLRRAADGTWHIHRGHDLSLPSTVHAVYQSQLDDLGADARRVATSGSVPGRSFPAGALPALGIDEPHAGLGELGVLGLLSGPHDAFGLPDTYTYRHTLLRDVAYATLSRHERALLHLRFADWMAGSADPALADELVGTHLAAAHASLPALTPLPEGLSRADVAAEAARRLGLASERHVAGQPRRAAELLEKALSLATGIVDRDTIAGWQLRRAEALRRAGLLADAMNAFSAAVDIGGPPPLAIEAALGYEDALFASRLPRDEWGAEGQRLLDIALGAADPADGATAALLAAAKGRALTYGGFTAAGEEWLGRAVQLARAADDPAAIAHALLAARAGQAGPEHLERRCRDAVELIEAAEAAGDAEAVVESVRFLFVDQLAAGRIDDALAARARAEAAIETLGQPQYLWYPAMWRAMEALRTGDPAARRHVEAFRVEGERWQYRDVSLVNAVQSVLLAVHEGTVDASLAVHEPAMRSFPVGFSIILTWALLAAGRWDAASETFAHHAHSDFAEVPRDLALAFNVALASEAAAVIGDARACTVLAEMLSPWRGQNIVLGSGALCLGAATHYLGMARAGMGDRDGAAELLAEAVRTNNAHGSRPAAERSRAVLVALMSDQALPAPGAFL